MLKILKLILIFVIFYNISSLGFVNYNIKIPPKYISYSITNKATYSLMNSIPKFLKQPIKYNKIYKLAQSNKKNKNTKPLQKTLLFYNPVNKKVIQIKKLINIKLIKFNRFNAIKFKKINKKINKSILNSLVNFDIIIITKYELLILIFDIISNF